MEFYKNQLCISYAELTAGDPLAVDPLKRPILSESNFKYYKKTGKLQVLNRACYGTPALVLYASLPDSVKQEVEARKGETFETEPKRYVLKEMIRRDPMAEQFFRGWTFEGRPHDHLKPEYVELYVANASALNAVLELTGNRSLFIKQYGKPYNRVWPETSRELNEIQDVVGCRLPKNHLALKRVALKYSEEGYESLISGKMKNNNARKNKESRQEALIVELIGDGGTALQCRCRSYELETYHRCNRCQLPQGTSRMLCRTLRKECTCQQQADAGDTYGPHCADVLLVCRRMGYGTVLPGTCH